MTYISIKQILDDLLDDPMMKGLSLERAINWAVEFMKIVGMPTLFEENTSTLTIDNYRAELPEDFYQIIQVRSTQTPKIAYTDASSDFGVLTTITEDSTTEDINTVSQPFTYVIKGNYIYVSKEESEIEIKYTAFKVDDEGFPMITDNSSFIRALELYIQKRWFTQLFNSGKITTAVLQNTQQEYAFAVGQAQSDLIRPSLDQMQSITNMWTALLPRVREHAKGFRTVSSPEFLKF